MYFKLTRSKGYFCRLAKEPCTWSVDPMNQNKQIDLRYNDFAMEWNDSIVPEMFNEKNTSIETLLKRCEQYQSWDYQYK